ncbi:Isochorismatase hydrolase [Violaceomyces palustris]|uniref:Isochorismatase hydrolase n=1 Tax=Violaceomyces palustris TaxID=1673888 RepID=A0ACD0NY09_9BASI|nr:Isochorismatase hydrolase [Violaceomyces palustris]
MELAYFLTLLFTIILLIVPSGAVPQASQGSPSSTLTDSTYTSTNLSTATTSAPSSTSTSGSSSNSTSTTIVPSGPDVSGANATVDFGSNYAVLFLDYIEGIVASARANEQGQTFLNNSIRWYEAINSLEEKPFVAYSRVAFYSDQRYEVASVPWGFNLVTGGNNFTEASNNTQVISEIAPKTDDYVFLKKRYSAFVFNDAIQTLRAQNVTTVVLSGIRASGVIISSIYALFDNDFRVFVIADNVYEPEPNSVLIKNALLGEQGIVTKLPANVISLDQALKAIGA